MNLQKWKLSVDRIEIVNRVHREDDVPEPLMKEGLVNPVVKIGVIRNRPKANKALSRAPC